MLLLLLPLFLCVCERWRVCVCVCVQNHSITSNANINNTKKTMEKRVSIRGPKIWFYNKNPSAVEALCLHIHKKC